MQLPAMKKTSNARRIPKQKRSIEKVEKILDCAAQMMAENSADDISTHSVAARAGIAIGSVYQFFPNIEMIKIALIERVMNKLYLTILETLEQSGSSNLLELTTDMIDASLAFYERHQDTARTIILSQHSEAFLIVNEKINARIIEAIVAHIRRHDKSQCEDTVKRRVSVSVAVGDAMAVLVWSTKDPLERAELVKEWKIMVGNYALNINSQS